ncbi:hypothetical protein KUCAC02_009793 [Chaenocephalus aceratus]|uniref:Uncharacterized protein n=1 Tax=Chaenocephalus aceratus TaxID=36190 RepID=A0ACB9VXA1_CHAAC|nr:hypothetical protein KUCAC02_009793 [Chaenocephalus aceratus]
MMEPSMENCLTQVLQKDMGRRLQVGQEVIDYILDKEKSHDLEQDQTGLDKMIDGIASTWVNCSNFKDMLLLLRVGRTHQRYLSEQSPACPQCPTYWLITAFLSALSLL